MDTINEIYPFQVSIWLSGNGNMNSLFEKGRWMEYARCTSTSHAEEIGLCLFLRNPQGVKVARLDEESSRFVAYKFYPETAKELT